MSLRKRPVAIIATAVGIVIAIIVVVIATGRGANGKNDHLGHTAPAIAGPGINTKGTVSLSDAAYSGRWVLVNFGASWCAPCRLELPQLQKFDMTASKYHAAILTVDADATDVGGMAALFESSHVSWKAVSDQNAAVAYGLGQIPESYLVAPNHEVVAIYQGMITATTVDKDIVRVGSQLGLAQ